MVEIAFLTGISSYIIFGLGLLGKLTQTVLWPVSLSFLSLFVLAFGGSVKEFIKSYRSEIKKPNSQKITFFLLLIFLLQAVVNLIGALGPELGFDALWYHLTLPKIYLNWQKIFYLPGGLLYYSAMPKLMEMIYLLAVFLKNEILAKLIHFFFGILCFFSLYNLSCRYLKKQTAFLASLIFYSSLVVGWQSITAYVDLARTFFEILALDLFLKWTENNKEKDLIESAIMLGLAISTKLLSLGSIPIYLFLIFLKTSKKIKNFLQISTKFLLTALIIPLPWLVFSWVQTKNPVYPIFSQILDQSHQIPAFSIKRVLEGFFQLFLRSQDPLSPIFLILFPLIIIKMNKAKGTMKYVFGYAFLSYLVWYFTPRVGGGRFILPYFPTICLICGWTIEQTKNRQIKNAILFFVFLSTLTNLAYRFAANKKYLPVVLGKQTKTSFLKKNLNFEFGDFYDLDGYFKQNIGKEDLVLISGIHNLFYVDFPFVHESWAQPGMVFTHWLVKGNHPEDFLGKREIYNNRTTGVSLYLFKGENQ